MAFLHCLLGVHRYRFVHAFQIYENDKDTRPVGFGIVQRCTRCGKIHYKRIYS